MNFKMVTDKSWQYGMEAALAPLITFHVKYKVLISNYNDFVAVVGQHVHNL